MGATRRVYNDNHRPSEELPWKIFITENMNRNAKKFLEGETQRNLLEKEVFAVNDESTFYFKRKPKKIFLAKFVVLLFLSLMSFSGIFFMCFTNIIPKVILTNKIIADSNKIFRNRLNSPVKNSYKIYVFNYTNVDDFFNGTADKFKIEEIGPYIYSEYFERVNVTFDPSNGTVSFRERRHFGKFSDENEFSDSDEIISPNIPPSTEQTFRHLTVRELLWDDHSLLMKSMNRTFSTIYTVNTGENDLNSLNMITGINGLDKFNFWTVDECDRIDGTDGTQFPISMLDRNKTIHVTNWQLRRRLPYVYEKDTEILDGIRLYKYAIPKSIFDSCCDKTGLFVNPEDSEITSSFPHFYLGDPELGSKVIGLKPNAEKHASYIDIYPILGLSLHSARRLQHNILFRGSYLPVIWYEIVEREVSEAIMSRLSVINFIMIIFPLIMIAGFSVIFVISALLLILNVNLIN